MRRQAEEAVDQLRPKITRNFKNNAEGSVLIECGDNQSFCTATGSFWRAAFFEKAKPKLDYGKNRHVASFNTSPYGPEAGSWLSKVAVTVEIQRLIGRSLRAAVDLTTR